jgi:hypothetical protein
MKTRYLLPLLAGLALTAGFVPSLAAAAQPPENVTVTFQEPDKFTDVRENQSETTSTYYLDVLQGFLQETASSLIPADQKLTVTVLDIDLAGETRNGHPSNVRVMTATTLPRIHLKFQVLDADGKVLQEGERKLTDLNYQNQIRRPGSDEPLFYDKELLRQWLRSEFKAKP